VLNVVEELSSLIFHTVSLGVSLAEGSVDKDVYEVSSDLAKALDVSNFLL